MGGFDIYGNPTGTDVHGKVNDKNVFGERPKNSTGTPLKDIFGNETGSTEEEKKEE